MVYREDVEAVDPVLELTVDYVDRSLRCDGTLDARTRSHVIEAAEDLLARRPSRICIDISSLRITDAEGANALGHIQRMARDAGAVLDWRGLDADRLQGLAPPRRRPRPGVRCPPIPLGAGRTPTDVAC